MRIILKILGTLGILGFSVGSAFLFINSVWGNMETYLYYLFSIRYGGEIGFFILATGGCGLLIALAILALILIYKIWTW